MAVDRNDFKKVLRSWVSGVTVVTARNAEHVHGMTVSAFSSVSADPPLVLICASRSSQTNGVIREGRVFNVNILSSEQSAISSMFAQSVGDISKFEQVAWHPGKNGAPIIDAALASLECSVTHEHEEGSHTIYVGAVHHAHTSTGEPLVYYDGSYRKLNSGC